MSAIGDAAQVKAAARAWALDSSTLDLLGRQCQSELNACDFEAVPKSVNLSNAAERRRLDCSRLAFELQDLSRQLENHATWIEETEAEVRKLENRIRDWMASNPAGSSPTGTDAGMVGRLPESLTLEWKDLAAKLRSQGVAF